MAKLENFNVQDGETAVITGKLAFGVLKTPNVNTQGKFPDQKPTYRVSLDLTGYDEAKAIQPGDPSNPAKSQNFLRFLNESVYSHRDGTGRLISAKRVAVRSKIDPATNQPMKMDGPRVYDEVHSGSLPSNKVFKGELAQGQELQVFVRAFSNGPAVNMGWGIEAIKVPDVTQVQYFGAGGGGLQGFNIDAFGLNNAGKAPMSANANPAANAPVQNNSFASQAPQQPQQPAQSAAPAGNNQNPFDGFTQPAQPNNQNNDNNPFANTDVTGNEDSPF